MIIQCRKCDTKFRFDEALVTEDGAWVRCSRCQHVFFQDNPIPQGRTGPQPEVRLSEELPASSESQGQDIEKVLTDRDASEEKIVEKEAEPIHSWEREVQEILKDEQENGVAAKEFGGMKEISAVGGGRSAKVRPVPGVKRIRRKGLIGRFIAYLVLIILILVLLGGLYLLAFPQDRQEVVDILANYIPLFEKLRTDQSSPGWIAQQVMIQDVRQHVVNNLLVGNLRVVEGTAVNTGTYSLTRLQVRGKLFDGGGNVIGEQMAFCGNLLTDAEMATSTQEEIQKKLSQPLGSNVPTDRVKPNDQIPFMIVFFHEPPSVAKVTVAPAGAERLLE